MQVANFTYWCPGVHYHIEEGDKTVSTNWWQTSMNKIYWTRPTPTTGTRNKKHDNTNVNNDNNNTTENNMENNTDANVDTRRNINKSASNTVTDAENVPGDITGHSKQITYTCTTDKH